MIELSDLKNGMHFLDLHALVVNKSVGTAKNGQPYADITLNSGSTSVRFKKWSYNAEKWDELFTVGRVVKISGSASIYNGDLQGEIKTAEASDRSPDEFAKRTRFDVESMYASLMAIVESFTEPLPKHVVTTLLTKHKADFIKSPAALGVHQAWIGGLLEHTFSMTSLALRVIEYYQKQYSLKNLSRDKVLFGVLMHDLGKIFEYDCSTPAFKKTPNGVLVNHIVKTPLLIYEAAMEWKRQLSIPQDVFDWELDQLLHLIVSHHGTYEFGSPVVPASLEAILVHHLDMLDSSFMHVLDLVEGKEGKVEGFSDYSKIKGSQFIR